jgi:hypothetical protein
LECENEQHKAASANILATINAFEEVLAHRVCGKNVLIVLFHACIIHCIGSPYFGLSCRGSLSS